MEWPVTRPGFHEAIVDGEDTSSTSGTSVVFGNNNSKGSYVEIVASTAKPAAGFILVVRLNQLTYDALIDIAIGSAGSEVVILENILVSLSSQSTLYITCPIPIPSGTRISARGQGTASMGTQSISLEIIWFSTSDLERWPCRRATTYGADTSDSGGVGLDPGGTAGTWSSWIEIVASTTNPIRQMSIILGDRANGTASAGKFLIDVGVGAAGSEQTILRLPARTTAQSDTPLPNMFSIIPIGIPAGTRIAARIISDIIDATDRLLDIEVIGFD